MGKDTALLLGIVGVVEQHEVMREGRLQARVTHANIQRIGVISDGEQVLHTGLTTAATVGQTQLAHFGEANAQVHVRSKVGYVAGGIRHVIILAIRELGVLRLHRSTQIELPDGANETQSDHRFVVEVLVLRIFTLLFILQLFITIR